MKLSPYPVAGLVATTAIAVVLLVPQGTDPRSRHVVTLERLQQLAPQAERQREIVRLHGELRAAPAQRRALEVLVARFDAKPAEYLALARLQLAEGQSRSAAATLDTMSVRHPGIDETDVMALRLSTLLVAGEDASAVRLARDWLAARCGGTLDEASELVTVLTAASRADLVPSVLTGCPAALEHPALVAAAAEAEARAGRPTAALAMLRRSAERHADVPRSPDAIARLYIRLGRAGEALAWFERLRAGSSSQALEHAWALAAAAAGRGRAVADWLDAAEARSVPAHHLEDLRHLAEDTRQPVLAVAVARRLLAEQGGDDEHARLVQALVDDGRPQEGTAHLRSLRGRIDAETHARLLTALWRVGAPVREELSAVWARRLAQSRSDTAAETAVSMLKSLGALASAFEPLRQRAERDPQHWAAAFVEAASAAGRPEAVPALWRMVGSDATTPAAVRHQAAVQLLESGGDKVEAERILRALAMDAELDAPVMRDLLFVWGPRPTTERLDWLAARAAGVPADDLPAWLRALADRGAASRALAVVRARPAALVDASVLDVYRELLVAVAGARPGALAAVLRDELERVAQAPAVPPAHLAGLAMLALSTEDRAVQHEAAARALDAGVDDVATRRTLGLLALRAGDLTRAERALAGVDGDAEVAMVLGDLRLRRRDTAGARAQFARALALLDNQPDSREGRRHRATLLHRLDRLPEALPLYEALLAEEPGDRNLRADVAAALLASGAVERAERVLTSAQAR